MSCPWIQDEPNGSLYQAPGENSGDENGANPGILGALRPHEEPISRATLASLASASINNDLQRPEESVNNILPVGTPPANAIDGNHKLLAEVSVTLGLLREPFPDGLLGASPVRLDRVDPDRSDPWFAAGPCLGYWKHV